LASIDPQVTKINPQITKEASLFSILRELPMIAQVWPISTVRASTLVLIFTALFFSSQLALAQFTQQGPKLVGTGAVGAAEQGWSLALSADGNTAIVGGAFDNSNAGAAWVYTRSGGLWTKQGSKLVGSGAVGNAYQGWSVALSADGNTAIVGGWADNSVVNGFGIGAAWVFTRSNGVWTQQGSKLVGTGAVGPASQGYSVALSADGNTASVGGPNDNADAGAAWVYTRSGGVWTQQGSKLVGSGATIGNTFQGISVALSADGNTAIAGGVGDNTVIGASWVYTRSNGVWTQQGSKLVGTDAVGMSDQGVSLALSADGNTAIVGGNGDNYDIGAAWVYTRSGGVWTQQGNKLVGTGASGNAQQGYSVALSADGNTAFVGGPNDNPQGAAWVYTRSNGVWTQQGNKLVGTGAVGNAGQGNSAALSGDAGTVLLGGPYDNSDAGAAWIFVQPTLQVTPSSKIVASGTHGGPFSPRSFQYALSATFGSVSYSIANVPSWLTVSSKSGTVNTSAKTITFMVKSSAADKLAPNTYVSNIDFNNTTNNAGDTTLLATLTVNPKEYKLTVEASPRADGTVSGGGKFAEGSSQTVTAMPNAGHTFVHWTEAGRVVSTSESYMFTLNGNVTLVADFR
jgi:antibiotic biosynthesis monooxygenase (ABM) superfamily enzyme